MQNIVRLFRAEADLFADRLQRVIKIQILRRPDQNALSREAVHSVVRITITVIVGVYLDTIRIRTVQAFGDVDFRVARGQFGLTAFKIVEAGDRCREGIRLRTGGLFHHQLAH